MNILELNYKGKIYKNINEINKILTQEKFYWLIDSEVENAKIEIQNQTLIWNDGIYMSGNWIYGIFKNGLFYGNWKNGIFEGGYFNGNWQSGINLTKNNF